MSSSGAAITALAGRGDSAVFDSNEYRIILPQLPSGEAMKRAVVLHGDIACRPYRIEDFRQPLGEAGVLGDVVRLGAFQMSHVWLLDLRTDAAKQKLLEMGRLTVKGRTCIVVDPFRQEVRIKLHCVAFGVTNDTIHRAFSEYGVVKEVAHERWRVPGFDGVESTTRIVRLVLREGVALDRLPHQLRLGGGTVLVVVPGRAPICLRCRMTGHIRRDCRAPRCAECHAFGHERDDCVRSYASAAGRGASDVNNDELMDEEEAEKAAAPAGALPEQPKEGNDATRTVSAEVNAPSPQQPSAAAPASQQVVELVEPKAAITTVNNEEGAATAHDAEENMDDEAGSAKRPLEDDSTVSQEHRQHQHEKKWKMVAGWTCVDGKPRPSASRSRDKLTP
ncbi:uncharacterized protein ISCGN_001463 [Ixodes scapularis]